MNLSQNIRQTDMIFLTFNDSPSGIFKSQVIEVCELFDGLIDSPVLLISFIPRQNYLFNRKKIQSWRSGSLVIPIIPGLRFWRVSLLVFWTINQFLGRNKIIARGSMACSIALKSRRRDQKVVYDARGAVKAEIDEFGVFQGALANEVIEMEKESVKASDFRISVSKALVDYWSEVYNYTSNQHAIIPCWSKAFDGRPIDHAFFKTSQSILVYSGSTSPWQSFPLLIEFISKVLKETDCKVLMMCKENDQLMTLESNYPDRVLRIFVEEENVHSYLKACDFGLLLRNQNLTNRVASPVKFSEYLACGLKVLITPNLGDYSELVRISNVGDVLHDIDILPLLEKPSFQQKQKSIDLAKNLLSSDAFLDAYNSIVKQ